MCKMYVFGTHTHRTQLMALTRHYATLLTVIRLARLSSSSTGAKRALREKTIKLHVRHLRDGKEGGGSRDKYGKRMAQILKSKLIRAGQAHTHTHTWQIAVRRTGQINTDTLRHCRGTERKENKVPATVWQATVCAADETRHKGRWRQTAVGLHKQATAVPLSFPSLFSFHCHRTQSIHRLVGYY